jgi:hypothetical protein
MALLKAFPPEKTAQRLHPLGTFSVKTDLQECMLQLKQHKTPTESVELATDIHFRKIS